MTGRSSIKLPVERIPGLGSLRGRYFYFAAGFILFLMVAAVVGQLVIRQATEAHFDEMRKGARLSELLRGIMLRERELETSLQRFVLTPGESEKEALLAANRNFTAELQRLRELDAVHGMPEHTEQLVSEIEQSARNLQTNTLELIEIRLDVSRWFPVMQLMLDRLLPDNTEFYTQIGLAIEDTGSLMNSKTQREVYRYLVQARQAWLQAISEFRLAVANRFGVFTADPIEGVKVREENVLLFLGTVGDLLDRLEALDRDQKLGFVASLALPDLRALHSRWYQSYLEAIEILKSDSWRTDLPLMQEVIDPEFAGLRRRLHELQQRIETTAREDAGALSRHAGHLSTALWVAAFSGVAITIIGFLLFQRAVLQPIERVARALRAEARGTEQPVMVPDASTEETRILSSAFNDMREQVHMRQQRLQDILDNAAEGIITIDEQGIIQSFNNAAQWLFGYRVEEAVGHNVSMLLPEDRREKHDRHLAQYLASGQPDVVGEDREVNALHRDGTIIPISIKISETLIGGRRLYTALVADISERRAMVEHLRNMAERDGLTGLFNRAYFQSELDRVVERARHKQGKGASLLYIDLDNFKYVNDTLGHAAGDKLLVHVSGILNRRARKGDLIARFGGDEFVVLLYETEATVAMTVAEEFRRRLTEFSFVEQGERVDVACSVGVTTVHEHTRNADEVMAQADFACHLAKRQGRNQVSRFNPEMQDKMAGLSLDMGWSRRIKEAIEKDRFTLVCQPIVATEDQSITAYEVLVRMLDDDDSHILPGGFLPSAERFGLSIDIDRWVITQAIRTLAAQRADLPGLHYSINLSAATLTDTSVCDLIKAQLEQNGLPPESITFEVTETVAIADMAAARGFLSRLQKLGCRTALDDFGAGFTSFAYLRELPVDLVKIDGRYIRNLAASPIDQAMVRAMNEIVHVMGMRTVAEFVETRDCLEMLREIGVDYAQGYYISKPGQITACAAIAASAGISAACSVG